MNRKPLAWGLPVVMLLCGCTKQVINQPQYKAPVEKIVTAQVEKPPRVGTLEYYVQSFLKDRPGAGNVSEEDTKTLAQNVKALLSHVENPFSTRVEESGIRPRTFLHMEIKYHEDTPTVLYFFMKERFRRKGFMQPEEKCVMAVDLGVYDVHYGSPIFQYLPRTFKKHTGFNDPIAYPLEYKRDQVLRRYGEPIGTYYFLDEAGFFVQCYQGGLLPFKNYLTLINQVRNIELLVLRAHHARGDKDYWLRY